MARILWLTVLCRLSTANIRSLSSTRCRVLRRVHTLKNPHRSLRGDFISTVAEPHWNKTQQSVIFSSLPNSPHTRLWAQLQVRRNAKESNVRMRFSHHVTCREKTQWASASKHTLGASLCVQMRDSWHKTWSRKLVFPHLSIKEEAEKHSDRARVERDLQHGSTQHNTKARHTKQLSSTSTKP